MAFGKHVDSYAAFVYPNESGTSRARMNLYCKDGYRLYVIFADDPGVNAYTESSKTGIAHAPSDHYPWYVDLLRNEKPVYVTFDPDHDPPRFTVYAGTEPVGEEES